MLEKLAEPAPHAKALTILPRSLELFAMRGLVERWLAVGRSRSSSRIRPGARRRVCVCNGTAARPEWQGVEAVLLRPDGHGSLA